MTMTAETARDVPIKIAITGAGLSGLLAAWAAVQAGFRVLQIAPVSINADGRTTALLDDSISYLRELGLWDQIAKSAYPLKTMRIIDATGRLIRAPQVDFVSSEVGLEAFGFNIQNRNLVALLEGKLATFDRYTRIDDAVTNLEYGDNSCTITTQSGQSFSARAIMAADGRNSPTRASIGISERKWQYPQVALVGNFTHTLPHHDVSTEFHTPTGPFTLVPLGTNRSSLVCVVTPSQAERLLQKTNTHLERYFEQRMDSVLGKVTLEDSLKSFPLSAMIAERFGKGPVALIGEAAHVFPPIGAQGLNLGLRDVREAIACLRQAGDTGKLMTIGDAYHRSRRNDVAARTTSVDLLNRSLLSDFVPVQAIRSLGLYTLGTVGPLRRLMMREGVAPGLGLESLRNRARGSMKNISRTTRPDPPKADTGSLR